jgi:hypothetical protein
MGAEEKGRGGPGEAAVRRATGRGWDDWFALLDEAGGREMDHKGLVAHIAADHDIGGWWQQSVAVAYEKARGMRRDHEKPGSFEISRSRTVAAPLDAVYALWVEEGLRRRWLEETVGIRKETQGRSIRLDWAAGGQILDVRFSAKGPDRTQVAVQHTKLRDPGEAEAMKEFWAEALTRLQEAAAEE